MFKKLLLTGLVALTCLNAADKEISADRNLYKNFKIGEPVEKYKDLFKDKEIIDCKSIGVPVGNIAKCTIVSDNETLGIEKDFIMVIATIENRINSVHLLKTEEESNLSANLWTSLFKSNLKAYKTFNVAEGFLKDTQFVDLNTLIKHKIELEQKLLLKSETFSIDTLFVETKKDIKSLDFIKTMKSDPDQIIRMVEVVENFDKETSLWTIRLDFINPAYQAALQQLYIKNNKINTEGGI